MDWDARDAGGIASLVAVCLAAFHRQLSYWFTGPDTFSLIRSSRIQGLGDLWGILTEPLMAGTGFLAVAGFFRPVTQLSFSLDWALWGLDPTGYHATNLLLHTTATLLVYVLARRLTDGSRGRALLAAGLFTLHPVAAESVPAISRRQDALASVLLLGSLVAYLRTHDDSDKHRGWWAASLGLALAAFGAKEVAIVLPGVILAHAWIVDRDAPAALVSLERARWASARAAPYVIVAGAFAAWRTAVLGGLGGYPDRAGLVSRWNAWEVGGYLTALVSPLRYAQVALGLSGPELAVLLAALAGALVAGTAVLYRGEIGRLASDLRRFATTRTGRVSGFCTAWVAGGLVLFAAARTFDDWSAYQFAVPLSIAATDLLVGGHGALRRSGSAGGRRRAVRNGRAIAAVTVLLGASIATTLAYSPSVRGSEAWETNGELQRAVLPPLATAVGSTSRDVSPIRAHGLAWEDRTHDGSLPQVHTVFYFQNFTLEDWLALQCPEDCPTDVVTANATALHEAPETIEVEFEPKSDDTADLHLSYES